jgi:phenylalanyl-tRNA synthetase beta chain
MKISYAWVREFVDLSLTAAEAADRLTNAGIEVAGVTPVAPAGLAGVVVGEIQAIERELGESHGHRLLLCRVSTGRRTFSVVCGAPNTRPGVRAAFAPPGARLPGGREVGVATIRGVESQGMLCSERELGLGEEHERGLLAVDADAPLGQDLIALLGLDDHVLEVEVTPNRPDCLSVVGVARELAALTGTPFRPAAVAVKEAGEGADSLARLRIEAPDLCRRYTARVITGLRVGPSPAWMAARLRAVGLRPISNVVDVTNYVLWELGHPLHAFDHARIEEQTVIVRRARAGERFTTLDGQERVLGDRMLVIADPRRAIGLAGVMGGANTEVTERTERVLLESAWFDPATTRRTSRALGLATDAAYRFERGADIEGLVDAQDRAAQLMADLAGGVVARGMLDAHPAPRPRPRVRLRMARVQRVLGFAPERAEARRILAGLGLPVTDRGDDLEVEVPGFRRDIALEDDLVEEVIRVWGYDRIPSIVSSRATGHVAQPPAREQEDVVRRALVGAGLTEAITYSFTDPAREAARGGLVGDAPLALLNPLSRDASVLRRHLLDGLLGVVATNARRQQPNVRVFEIGKVYGRDAGEPSEARWAGIVLTGTRGGLAWHGGQDPVDVYDVKGLAEHVLATLGLTDWHTGAGLPDGFEPDCCGALLSASGRVLAIFGEVAREAREQLDVEAPVFAAMLPLDWLLTVPVPAREHHELPRFPFVQRDVAFLVEGREEPTAAAIADVVRREGGPLLREVALFDVFRFPDGRRNLAWRLTFRADDRTLTDEEVNAIQERVGRRVAEQFGVTWRGM